MDTMNPLDWTAGPFILFYLYVAGGVLLLLAFGRNWLGGRATGGGTAGLGALHLAYLAGGAERAISAALVGLLEAGAAAPDRRRGVVRFDPTVPVVAELQPFRHVSGGEASRAGFQAEFAARWDRLHRELAARGLVPGAAEAARIRWAEFALLCVPLLLGVCKVFVGLSRNKPVGILVGLLALTALFGTALLLRRPHCNRAGVAALEAARQNYARAARAPLPEEMALAFALTGSAVLSGRDYRWALSSGSSSSSSDSGSSDSGGGDGGGGCGGCSG